MNSFGYLLQSLSIKYIARTFSTKMIGEKKSTVATQIGKFVMKKELSGCRVGKVVLDLTDFKIDDILSKIEVSDKPEYVVRQRVGGSKLPTFWDLF